MGVKGLLPLLKSIQRPTELKKFSGHTLGVDAYVWLHRGAIACAMALAQGKPTRKYVDYAMHRVRMMQHFGVTPYVVFDGGYLPSKAGTETSRRQHREESRRVANELLKAGKVSQATQEFQKAIDITPEMARNLIDELKKANVAYVVAPYEADAQLVYLERQGLIDGIISEDSDLLVFGCRRLLTKLDQYGQCVEINRRDFAACREISLTGWTDDDFRRMAILSGCDYLDGVNDIGLKTAYRLIRKHKTPERVIRMMQFEGKHRVSENYFAAFTQAELTFLHQRVFCPKKQELVMLTEASPGSGVEDMPFIGAALAPEVARAIAVGDVNPITKEPIVPAELPQSKRRHSQLQATVSRPSQPGKPIDSYFKGHHRVPMGEMDKNCFSVDPQRLAAITQNGLVPRVFPLPRPYLDETAATPEIISPLRSHVAGARASPRLQRRRTEPVTSLLPRPAQRNPPPQRRKSTDAAATLGAGADDVLAAAEALMTGSGQRPPKKARLCEDASVGAGNVITEKSRWFSPAVAKTTKAEAHLFSDDSIDEALLNLPDVDGWHQSQKELGKEISVFDEESQGTTTTTSTEAETQSSSRSDDQAYSQLSDIGLPSPSPKRENASATSSTRTPHRASLQRFSYLSTSSSMLPRPTLPRSAAAAAAAPTPSTLNSRRASLAPSIFTPAASTPSTAASSLASRLTPLQRLGARALQRKQPPPASPMRAPKPAQMPAAAPADPAFVPLPQVDLAEVEALTRACGSEDLLVPGDEEAEGEGVEEPVRGLDLSRFLCS